MALRLSTGLRNGMLKKASLADLLDNGKLYIYPGSQPSSANTAPGQTALAIITNGSGTHTAEVLAQGSVTLSTTASGSVDTLLVDSVSIISGAVAFDTDYDTTAVALAANINAHSSSPDYTASASGAVVTITAQAGTGVFSGAVTGTETGMTVTKVAVGTTTTGVAAANGLLFGSAAAGVLSKLSTQTWSGAATVTGTAGWFRFIGSQADAMGTDTTETVIRLDGSIATSGGELNMSSTSITNGATQTVSSFAITLPTS